MAAAPDGPSSVWASPPPEIVKISERIRSLARDSHDILGDPPPPPADVRLPYGPEPLQFGDLRLPGGAGPHPLAVVVHGGYWKANWNLIHTGHMCGALAAAGIATWNLEYRRAGDPGGGWPGSADDVARGVEHAARLAERYPLDPGRTVLVGHSAGGHLALVTAKRLRLPTIALAPVSDLRESWRRGDGCGAAAAFLGSEDAIAAASPRELLPLGVPHLVVHGTEDDVVPFAMSRAYAEAAGGEAELVPLEGAGHFEPVDPLAAEWPRVAALIAARLSG
jgi:acetyl esterase/lipase